MEKKTEPERKSIQYNSPHTHGVTHTERRGRTLAEVSEGVVALLGEGDLIDGVPQVAVFQQTAGVLPRIPPIFESFYSGVKPVHHVGA